MIQRLALLLIFAAGCNERTIDPTLTRPALDAPCHFSKPADPNRTVFAAVTEGRLTVAHADGSRAAAHIFGGDAPIDSPFTGRQVTTRGNQIAASAEWSLAGNAGWRQEVVVRSLDDNRLLFQRTWSNTALVTMQLGPDGVLALNTGDGGGLLWDPSGESRELSGWWPVVVGSGGAIAVRSTVQGEGTTQLGWLRKGSNTIEAVAYPELQSNSTTFSIDDRLVYLGQKDGAPFVVSELPGDARAFPLPAGGSDPLALSHFNAGGWVLVGTWQDPLYRVNLHTGEVTVIGVRTPDGLMRFQSGFEGPMLDGDGALLLGMRDEIAGGLYRSQDGSSWTRVGGSISQILDIVGVSRSGTYLVDGTNSRYASEMWADPTAAEKPDVIGNSIQIVRPGASVQRLVADADTWEEPQESLLSSDGLCFAYWSTDATQTQYRLKSLDVQSGEVVDLLDAPASHSFDAVTWVTGD